MFSQQCSEGLKTYNKTLEVVNAIQKEAKECAVEPNLHTLSLKDIRAYVVDLVKANNIPDGEIRVEYVDSYLGSYIVLNADEAYSLSIPYEYAARAYLYSKLLSIGNAVSDFEEHLVSEPEFKTLLQELADIYGLVDIQRDFTVEEIQQHEEVYKFWCDEDDLVNIAKAVAGLYLRSNSFRRETALARAFAAQAVLAYRNNQD